MNVQKLRVPSAILILSSFTFANSSLHAAPVQDPVNGHYYEVFLSSHITWNDALAAALSQSYLGLQGHLATITDTAEDGYVGTAVAAAGSGEFWLGGYQNPVTETTRTAGWTWVNSEGTFPGVNGASGFDNTYSNWNPGEPNDFFGTASEQFLGINLGSPGAFNDEGDLGQIHGYVVEFDPNTVPGGGLAGRPTGAPDTGSSALLLVSALTLLGGIARRGRS